MTPSSSSRLVLMVGAACLLAACPPPYAMVIRSAAGPMTFTAIYTDQTRVSGAVPYPNAMLLRHPVEDVEAIEYGHDGRSCRLEGAQLRANTIREHGKDSLTLPVCAPVTAP